MTRGSGITPRQRNVLPSDQAAKPHGAWLRGVRLGLFAASVVGTLFGLVLLALGGVIPHAFTGDDAVVGRAHAIWWLFAALMPLNGAVFALDGILIGAGDTRYLAISMVVAGFGFYVPIALAALHFEWGILGVWCGLIALMAVRLATLGARFRSRRWAVVGAPPSPA